MQLVSFNLYELKDKTYLMTVNCEYALDVEFSHTDDDDHYDSFFKSHTYSSKQLCLEIKLQFELDEEFMAQFKSNYNEEEIAKFLADNESNGEFKASDMEFGFIADKISELIKSGVRQDEIAIISYKRKYFMPLLPYLKSHPEINIAYEQQNDLFNDEKIHQILTIARLVYEIANERSGSVSIL